ncbi:hypothetical protein Tco_1392950 [Tanacetum coccineum]
MSLMGKVKEVYAIPNLYIILSKEGFQTVKLTYLGGLWVLIELDSLDSIDKFCKHVGVGSCYMKGNDFDHETTPNMPTEESPQSNDPFNIYELLQKKNVSIPLSKDSGPTYPPGFTPASENLNNGEDLDSVKDSAKD